jgi:hypothetical protein
MRKHWEKFIKKLNADEDILNTYRDLRRAFKREGWTEKDLEKPPYYPKDIMINFQKFNALRDKLFFEIRSFFGDIDFSDYSDYIKKELNKIDILIPLENGDNKRRDNWDEDFE